MSDGICLERLQQRDIDAFLAFCAAHWPGEHPLIHNKQMFEYYYRDADGGLNFAVARDPNTGALLGVCGYIKANDGPAPDVWISYILSKKGAPLNLGFRLLETVRRLTGCRTIACNNIRKKTRGLYEFMGWRVADMTQYYRLNENIKNYTFCIANDNDILKVLSGDLAVERVDDAAQLEGFDFEAYTQNQPYKDRHYAQKRYFDNPWIDYEVYAGREGDGPPGALLVARAFRQKGAVALRVVDHMGRREWAGRWGGFLDRRMKETGADFCDWFALGLDDETMRRAGFTPRVDGDGAIIPFYLSPPRMENVTVTCFTSGSDDYTMFRADGDQDRPNLG